MSKKIPFRFNYNFFTKLCDFASYLIYILKYFMGTNNESVNLHTHTKKKKKKNQTLFCIKSHSNIHSSKFCS